MPYASYLAIRKMIAKRRGRLGFVSHHFEMVIMVVVTALFVGLCVYLSRQ